MSGILESEISNYDSISVKILYSNIVGTPITVGSEAVILTGQPVSLTARSGYFETLFQKIDFRYSSLAIFDQFSLNGNFKIFTAIWNYVNGATEVYHTFKDFNYTQLIQMLPFITEFQIKHKEFYDVYLRKLTSFSTYDNYEVQLMRSATPKIIMELDNFFPGDRALSDYWKQRLLAGLSNIEGSNTNLATISIKPIEQKSELTCNIVQPSPSYIPTIKSNLSPTIITTKTF